MLPGERRGVSNAALKTEIEGVGKHVDEIKEMLVAFDERIRCLERAGDKTTPLTEKRIKDLEDKTKAHDQELKDLTELINIQAKSVDKLTNSWESQQKIWKWALGIFTVVVTAIIIMLVTGQATVIFK